MRSTEELATRIDAAFASMEARRRQFQEVETRKYEEWKQRLAKLGMEFDKLRDVFQPRLDLMIQRFGDKVTATPKIDPVDT